MTGVQTCALPILGISKSMGLAQISFSEAYADLNPDLIIVLGDRYEIFSAVSAAMIARIPLAHISGGETTEGAFDEAIRHSITKMSHLHFTGTEEYRKRVIQLGEHPTRVFNELVSSYWSAWDWGTCEQIAIKNLQTKCLNCSYDLEYLRIKNES